MVGAWFGTGQQVLAEQERLQRASQQMDVELERARRTGSHYWLAIVGFKVDPPMTDGSILDVENLRQYPVVACYLCEQEYTERIAQRRCKPVD